MRIFSAPVAVCLLFLNACGTKEKTIVVQGEVRKVSTSGPCPVLLPATLKRGVDFECGSIISPVEKDNADTGDIRVAFFRIFSKDKTSKKSPLVVHFGGPGDDGEGPFQWSASQRNTLAADRDLIAIGQRGTTHSFVIPDCPQIDPQNDSIDGIIDAENQSSGLCKRLLDNAGITLSAFSTVSGVRDVEALRVGLGYEKISFYGVSYGTMFALEYARQFPTTLDRLILDSTIPPNLDMAESHINEFSDISRYLSDLKNRCQNSSACLSAYGGAVPNFSQLFESVVSSNQPLLVISGQPKQPLRLLLEGRSAGMNRVKRIQFAAMIQAGAAPSGSYTSDGLDTKFSQVLALWRGLGVPLPSDSEIALGGRGSGGGRSGFSSGINTFLNCTEIGFASSSVVSLIGGSGYSFIGSGLKQSIIDLARIREAGCSAFKPQNDAFRQSFGQAVQSSAKTYLFNSTFDSATPLKNAQLAAKSLKDATLFEFACTAHGVILSSSEECEKSILTKALDGSLNKDDVGCVCAN